MRPIDPHEHYKGRFCIRCRGGGPIRILGNYVARLHSANGKNLLYQVTWVSMLVEALISITRRETGKSEDVLNQKLTTILEAIMNRWALPPLCNYIVFVVKMVHPCVFRLCSLASVYSTGHLTSIEARLDLNWGRQKLTTWQTVFCNLTTTVYRKIGRQWRSTIITAGPQHIDALVNAGKLLPLNTA